MQVARIERRTHLEAPIEALARDLFLAVDGAAALRALVQELPRLLPDVQRSIEQSALARPREADLNPLERAVEAMLRECLLAVTSASAGECLTLAGPALREWVQERAARFRAESRARYRGLPGFECWGELVSAAAAGEALPSRVAAHSDPRSATSAVRLPRRPTPRRAESEEDDKRPGMFIVKPDASQQSVEDPRGLSRPMDQGSPDAAELADALSELPEARLVRAPGTPREILLASDTKPSALLRTAVTPAPQGFIYPEWDYRTQSYRAHGSVVRSSEGALGDPHWAERALQRHARLVSTLCASFAQLRPQRARLRRQPDGAEIDIDACVTAFADRLAGSSADDSLYEDVRPRRRDLALLVLFDASASTDASIQGRERIIDVEKDALLLVCKAIEQLRDRYAVYGFSGETAGDVRVQSIKHFDAAYDGLVERRIAGLEPDRYTRLGAALRHTALLLGRERARHQLLLIVSDGKPNDVDEYEGRYGVEDTRQAIIEARLQGLHPFCITVDCEAPAYARYIFGPNGYTVLRDARALPRVLLDVLRRLVTT
jgi:nitric oxide reductase NorD protein